MGQFMNKFIVFKDDDGGISIIKPVEGCGLTAEEIAAKDVPAGKKYKLIDPSDLPEDRYFRNAWDMDESEMTDGVGENHGN
tara:strand:- start:1874 stop:2116 length:243 start_codon:yes stop_codon:yes gene_type:complete